MTSPERDPSGPDPTPGERPEASETEAMIMALDAWQAREGTPMPTTVHIITREAYRMGRAAGERPGAPREPSEEAIAAAFRMLWGHDPEQDGGGYICARDQDRWNEMIEMLRAYEAAMARVSPPKEMGEPETEQEGTPE